MPRPTINIRETELRSLINTLESSKTFKNHSELFKAVCDSDWAKSLKNSAGNAVTLQPATVYQRVKEFGITLKTEAGKKGRVAGSSFTVVRTTRASKFSTNELVQNSIKSIRKNTPHGYKKLVDKIEAGSLKAAVRLKCLDCVNYTVGEIGVEACSSCPLAPFVFVKLSSYKKDDEDTSLGDDE